MSREDIEDAIAEALAAMRGAVGNGEHEGARTYLAIIERLQPILREMPSGSRPIPIRYSNHIV